MESQLADSRSNYLREAECTAFIVEVPTVWDETDVLAASVGDYIAVVRRSGESWYVGAMTEGESRDLVLDTDFLGRGVWSADVFRDGRNTARKPQHYQKDVHLAPAGGWLARLRREAAGSP